MKHGAILFILIGTLLGVHQLGYAQDRPITVRGVVMDADSIQVIPYVNIRLKNTFFGTVTDNEGRFTFTAAEGDTLSFTYVGYFETYFIMPKKMTGDSYSLIQLMRKETIMLEEVVVFPWPNYEELKKEVVRTQPRPGPEMQILDAKKKVKRISKEEYDRNKYYYNMYYNNQLYDLTGIVPANNFINPIEWSNFIRDVADKKYRNQKK